MPMLDGEVLGELQELKSNSRVVARHQSSCRGLCALQRVTANAGGRVLVMRRS